jgi:hypothetical protein
MVLVLMQIAAVLTRASASIGRLRAGRAAALACALCMVAVVLASPAYAHEASAPKYSLKIVSGETTQPEHNIAGVSAGASQRAPVRVRILQGTTVLYQGTGSEGWTGVPQVPSVGDTVTVESPLGSVVGSVTYDGLPAIESTVCAGSESFSGERSGAETVEGGFYTDLPLTDPYGHVYGYESAGRGQAQVTLLSGTSFGGDFLTALQLGETVYASEAVEVPLGGGSIFTYESEAVRPVGGCPAPPPAPAPAPAPVIPPLQASLARILGVTINALFKHGFSDHVYVNQPGTVTQALYLQGGKLPAYAASAHRKHKQPPALLLARGAASAHAAGDVTVVLHLTSAGRGRLRHAKSAHVVLVTTVTSATGVKVTLAHRSITLHR